MDDIYRWTCPDLFPGHVESTLSHHGPHKCLLAAIVRNEGPYLVEWAAYHYALGFREIIVFSNFCDDASDQLLDRLDDLGIIRHRPHPITIFPAVGQVQISALRLLRSYGQFGASDYMLMIDADEFLEIDVGQNDLASFMDATPDFEVASFAVRGRNALEKSRIEAGEMLPRFLLEAWPNHENHTPGERTVSAVKSLTRSKLRHGFHRNHRPRTPGFSQSGANWIDGAGDSFGADFTDRRVSSIVIPKTHQKALVNHYNIRSAEGFMVKVLRGDAASQTRVGLNTGALDNSIRYWKVRDEATQYLGKAPNTPPGFQALYDYALSDPVIAELQEKTLASHREKAAQAYETEAGRYVADAIGFAPE